VVPRPELRRETPWQEEHGTKIAGLMSIKGGDNRFFNNVFIAPAGLDAYDKSTRPSQMAGNVFLKGAKPSKHEESPLVLPDFDPALNLRNDNSAWFLEMNAGWGGDPAGPMVTSELLGRAAVPNLAFVNPDGSPYQLDRDFFGKPHHKNHPRSGPFAEATGGGAAIQMWPVSRPQ
jgi:hypothetical protein